MGLRVDVKRLIDAVTNRCVDYLHEESGVEVKGMEYNLQEVKSLTLRYLTSLVAVGGNLGLYIAFSFDEAVIMHLFKSFTEELDLGNEYDESLVDEAAGEIINTIIGNALADVPATGGVISLTPPVVLGEAKSIVRHRDAYFYTAEIKTGIGSMSVMCIGPEKLFESDLQYKEA